MKKILFTALSLLFLSATANAQNLLAVKIENNACVEDIIIHFQSGDPMEAALGCAGMYTLNVGNLVPESVIVNDVVCHEGFITDIQIDNGKPGTADFRRRGRITFKAKEGATLN